MTPGHERAALLGKIVALTILLGACAHLPRATCLPDAQPSHLETLYFGTDRAGAAPISDSDWQAFVTEEITPRFPQGLTTWTARGQWRGASGEIVAEGTHVLQIVGEDREAIDRSLREITDLYKRKFAQEAVLRIGTNACVSF